MRIYNFNAQINTIIYYINDNFFSNLKITIILSALFLYLNPSIKNRLFNFYIKLLIIFCFYINVTFYL